MFRTAIVAAAAFACAGTSIAQEAARSPAAQSPAAQSPTTQAPAAATAAERPVAPSTPESQRLEGVLRTTIGQLQAGTPDYDAMEPNLGAAVRAQSAAMTPMLTALGAVQFVEFLGATPVGLHEYRVRFASGRAMTWAIMTSPSGKIAGLAVRG